MVTAGDFNGDGKLDLAVGSGGTSPAMRVVSLGLPPTPTRSRRSSSTNVVFARLR
jgi:hypothetical protein